MMDAVGSVQSAVVLGGTSEIALATLQELATERLDRVTLAVRDVDGAEGAASSLRVHGLTVQLVHFDATDHRSHDHVISEAFAQTGEVDLVIVAHGLLGPGPEGQLEAALDMIDTNFVGAVTAMAPAVRELVRQGHGTLVVLSTVAAERPRASNYVYGASKAGLDAFAQGLGDTLVGTGVHMVVVRPGFVRTRMTDGMDEPPFAVGPEVVAKAIVAGIRRHSHTVWAPSHLRWVMLCLRLLPRAVFRRLPI